MIIYIKILSEIFYEEITFTITNELLLDLKNYIYEKFFIDIEKQNWFFDNKKINNDFKFIKGFYTIYVYDNDDISFKINLNNKKITSPFLSKNLTIKEVKDILSIKDNIYFKNIKLFDNKTLNYYKINNSSELNVIKYKIKKI